MIFVNIENICKYIEDLIRKGFALVCIGTYVRSDDRAALELCSKLQELKLVNTEIILCEHGLELCVHEIIEKKLGRIAIIDAIVVQNFVKAIAILTPDEVGNEILLSTHVIPLEVMFEYLKDVIGYVEVLILGIPAKNLEIGLDISTEVQEIINSIIECLRK